MADHLDAPGLTSPMGDSRTDITDVYAFRKPGDELHKSILVLNVNPLAPALASFFNSGAIYMINIDTDGDAVADRSFRIRFSDVVDGAQTATVHLATGSLAAGLNDGGPAVIAGAPASFDSQAQITTRGDYRFFAGLRSDPFFFDLLGFLNNLTFTGRDFFIDKNVFGIVLEVPNSALGASKVKLWARTLLVENGTLVRDDRMARPAINTVFNHGPDKNIFNSIDPDQDLTASTNDPTITFLMSFTSTLENLGKYTADQADAIARILLPDLLDYDVSIPSGYLNGRQLRDDVIDISLNLVTQGGLITDGVGPHSDYTLDFPYLGTPH